MPEINPVCVPELLSIILGSCSHKQLAVCSRVSQLWYDATSPLLYRHIVVGRKDFPTFDHERKRWTSSDKRPECEPVDLATEQDRPYQDDHHSSSSSVSCLLWDHWDEETPKWLALDKTAPFDIFPAKGEKVHVLDRVHTVIADLHRPYSYDDAIYDIHRGCSLLGGLSPAQLVLWGSVLEQFVGWVDNHTNTSIAPMHKSSRQFTYLPRGFYDKCCYEFGELWASLRRDVHVRLIVPPGALRDWVEPTMGAETFTPRNPDAPFVDTDCLKSLSSFLTDAIVHTHESDPKDPMLYFLYPCTGDKLTGLQKAIRETSLKTLRSRSKGNYSFSHAYQPPHDLPTDGEESDNEGNETEKGKRWIDKVRPQVEKIKIKALDGFVRDYRNGDFGDIFEEEQVEAYMRYFADTKEKGGSDEHGKYEGSRCVWLPFVEDD